VIYGELADVRATAMSISVPRMIPCRSLKLATSSRYIPMHKTLMKINIKFDNSIRTNEDIPAKTVKNYTTQFVKNQFGREQQILMIND
jgi:hypothetical protein